MRRIRADNAPGIQGSAGHLEAVSIFGQNVSHVVDKVEAESVSLVDLVLAAQLDAVRVMLRQIGVVHDICRR